MKTFEEYCRDRENFLEWLREEGYDLNSINDEIISEAMPKWLRNAGMAGALLGSGFGLGKMTGGDSHDPNQAAITAMDPTGGQNDGEKDRFWTSGVNKEPNGSISFSSIDMNQKLAMAKAYDGLARSLGLRQIPPGVTTNTEQQDGAYKVTVTYSKRQAELARQYNATPSILQQTGHAR